MVRSVLDASATLAVIFEEQGAEVVTDALRLGAVMSAVNVAEVGARLHQDGWTESEVGFVFENLDIEVLPFTREAALLSARLRSGTRRHGLGLGDRAALATGCLEHCPVLTADRIWQRLDIPGIDIRCIR